MKNTAFVFIALTGFLGSSQTPVTQNASKEVKTLLKYLYAIEGQTLSGQHSYNEHPSSFYNTAQEISGKTPAIWGTDFYWNGSENPGERIVKAAIEKHSEGSIITLMWHVGKPMDQPPYSWKGSVQSEISDQEWKNLTTPGSELHKKWLAQIDQVALYLKKLQDAHIPILWRPYHEMNGVWFWWGNKKGDEGFRKLWRLLFDRLVNHHQLNNLIWVWNANGPRDIPGDEAFDYEDFYPGAAFVDILATDVYHGDYEQKDYNQLLTLANGKPIALGEVGRLPTIKILKAQPKWSWFMVWSNWIETANRPEKVKTVYGYENIINRDEIQLK